MRVFVVASFKEGLAGNVAPFVGEQMEALQEAGIECDCFKVEGRGMGGYLKDLAPLRRRIKAFRPNVVHAHYGMCGLLANLQRRIPVVTTYHGSDINDRKALPFSKMAMRLSAWNIFVSKKTLDIANPKEKHTLLPCGIELSDLQLTERQEARQSMELSPERKYVLFAGAFDNTVKNAPLAKEVVARLHDENLELLELKGYSREEVTLLMCAADAFLMTSHTEGSPQVIKEAMACGCPIVSVDVGDVRERTEGVEGCFVAQTRNAEELAELLQKALAFEGKTKGRERIVADGLDNRLVAEKLVEIYKKCPNFPKVV